MNIRTESDLRFAICVSNSGYPASLELRKVYPVVPDADAATQKMLRVIDESGEDYLYPEALFMLVELPEAVRKALLRAA